MIPDIDPSGVIAAFGDFLEVSVVQWTLSILLGGSAAAFILRLIISAFWR